MKRRSLRWLGRGAAAAVVGSTLMSALPGAVDAAPWGGRTEFASAEFRALWNQTDANPGTRSLTWGPSPWWDYKEFYKDSPGGLRQVQYFDKARMEINDPDAAKTPFFVTNGLLPVEMISGRVKLGDDEVEMGNVGQHYFQWRYANQGTPWDPETPPYFPVAFASNRASGSKTIERIYTTDTNGNNQNPITADTVAARPSSVLRSWDQKSIRILGDVTQDNKRRIWSYALDGSQATAVMQAMQPTDGDDYHASVSPDGTKILFVSNRTTSKNADKNPEIFAMNLNGTGLVQLTDTKAPCANEYPTWRGDGSGIVWSTNCGYTNWEVVRTDLGYVQDKLNDLQINMSRWVNLTNDAGNDRYPRVSPDGSKIAFASDRGSGKYDLYVMSTSSGSALQALTTSANGNDVAPTWSPDSLQIIYQSDIEGDNEIYIRNLDPRTAPRQLTNNSSDDTAPIWAQ
jgi:Tol biopolymer transport system component